MINTHEDELESHSHLSLLKGNNDGEFGARAQISEDPQGRKHAHAVAVCDCNGQGSWKPLFRASQLLKTEFPDHSALHEEVNSHFRQGISDQIDNHLQEARGLTNRHNHMIHLHLIPHIYVPVMHQTGFTSSISEAKLVDNHSVLDDSSASLINHDSSSEFPQTDSIESNSVGQKGSTTSSEEHVSTEPEHSNNLNTHSGESFYSTINEEALAQQALQENFDKNIVSESTDNNFELSSNAKTEVPHQYQVHESEDLSNDYSSKKQVVSQSSTLMPNKSFPRHRKSTPKPNRSKYGRKLTDRQDLRNLLVMRPPPLGQLQTWKYVFPPQKPSPRHQFYKRTQPMMPILKKRTLPVILHIRQRQN
ncbi:uncharacterized protein LOC126895947 isoform X2 [Daktulosphaira vitifoliae]|nr:uncharacterized protein LOC126895947 isoform X2 [Daktulosphaira vitifoliae]XP_050524257.1 uncharacterized protein LOC126895947 isoform X2 [Daktulosphaira vitifoliae]